MVIVTIFVFFTCLHYFSTNEKCNRTQLDCGKMNDCAINYRALTTSGSNFETTAIRNTSHSLSTLEVHSTEDDREDAASYMYQQHEVFSIQHITYDIRQYADT